jgi:hypothetical protein
MKLLCSHGGRFQPCGPDGEPRYVGGETRVLVVSRAVSFRDLAARLAEMAGGGSAAEVRAISIRHRLADEGLEDVLVTVTCDQEVAHMRDEYDRLRATRPAARFRVFVTTTTTASSSSDDPKRAMAAGLPPLAPLSSMRRVQSEQAVAARAQHQHRPTTRRVHSAQELAGGVHMQPSFHHHHLHQLCCCCCSGQRRDRYTPAPPPARPTYALPYMSKKVAAPPPVPAAEAAGRVAAVSTEAAAAREKATSRDVEEAVESRRAIWELE